ncbi:MAG: hypothetical protein IKT44_03845 [Clostridia bacterium]|nr:hypothetical protein [Clostridia bacterium]
MNVLLEKYKIFLQLLRFSFSNLKSYNFDKSINSSSILSEALHQTVLPLIYTALDGRCDLTEYQSEYFNIIANNVKIVEEHKALHRLLFEIIFRMSF